MQFNDVANLVADEIHQLSENAALPVTLEWKAGEVIISKGKIGDYMYLVLSGKADIRIGDQLLETVGEEGIIGEVAMIDSPERSATVIAKTDITLAPIDRWKFRFLVQRHPDFALYIMELMSKRLRMMNERVEKAG